MVLLDHGGRDAAEFDIIAPPADLSTVVEHLWIPSQSTTAFSEWRVVADASPHLIATVIAEKMRRIRVVLVGARSQAATIDMSQRVLTVGVRLRPGALPAVVDGSARELMDRSVRVDDVFGAGMMADLELSHDAPPSVIARELLRLLRRARRRRDVRMMRAESLRPSMTVAALAERLGEPTRSLRERVHREVGLSPKRALRVLRLHDALHVRRTGATWSHVAHAAGYADQAHLTRELRDLLGETPSEWQARGSAVSFKTARPGVG